MRATLAVLPGDGIGPEVTRAAVHVLDAVAAAYGHEFACEYGLVGGAAIDAAGTPLPSSTIGLCRRADATLLGAVGGPQWDGRRDGVRPESGLLGIRRALDLFANIRPVAPHPRLARASALKAERLRGVDFVVVRELTGGIYFGPKSRKHSEHGVVARDVCTYSEAEIERVTRVGCELARGRRGKVTSVDKANVLETSRLWREVVTRVVRDEFPDLQLEHVLVDACAMHLILRPAEFDVLLTENMFGDILTDEAAVLAGSIGVLPSASVGEMAERRRGLYEPIHGSAPDIAGKGVANPIGAILSASLLLQWSLGLRGEAAAVQRAVSAVIERGALTADLADDGAPVGTELVADAVADEVTRSAAVTAVA